MHVHDSLLVDKGERWDITSHVYGKCYGLVVDVTDDGTEAWHRSQSSVNMCLSAGAPGVVNNISIQVQQMIVGSLYCFYGVPRVCSTEVCISSTLHTPHTQPTPAELLERTPERNNVEHDNSR